MQMLSFRRQLQEARLSSLGTPAHECACSLYFPAWSAVTVRLADGPTATSGRLEVLSPDGIWVRPGTAGCVRKKEGWGRFCSQCHCSMCGVPAWHSRCGGEDVRGILPRRHMPVLVCTACRGSFPGHKHGHVDNPLQCAHHKYMPTFAQNSNYQYCLSTRSDASFSIACRPLLPGHCVRRLCDPSACHCGVPPGIPGAVWRVEGQGYQRQASLWRRHRPDLAGRGESVGYVWECGRRLVR